MDQMFCKLIQHHITSTNYQINSNQKYLKFLRPVILNLIQDLTQQDNTGC